MRSLLLFGLALLHASGHAADSRLAPPTLSGLPTAGAPFSPPAGASAPGLAQREIRAQLSPRNYTTLAAEIGAKIQRLPVADGAAFRSGQVLVSFDCALPRSQLDRARASLNAVTKTWNANQRLSELNAIGRVEVDVSEAEVQKNRAEVAGMQAILAKCAVTAPFSGRIAEQKVREQQFVQPGQPLLEIIDDSVLELEFIVPSKWLAWLRPGYAFNVAIDETGKQYPARVLRIGARVDPVSQSVKLAAAIDGKFPELIAGMSGRINLLAPAGK